TPPSSATSPLSLHDALPISPSLPSGVRSSAAAWPRGPRDGRRWDRAEKTARTRAAAGPVRSCAGAGEIFDEPLLHDFLGLHEARSEEHTSELQSLRHLVCRL